MSKEKLNNQLKKAYKSLEKESKNKGRPNTIKDNNVDYDNCNIYAMRQKISDLEAKLEEKDEQIKELTECNQYLQIYRNQDKISFAVAYLEIIKAFIIDKEFYFVGEDYSTVYVEDITEEIDNQIKQLKGGK